MYYSRNLKKNKNIQHCFFSRRNGTSTGIYKSLNCGLGSNDNKINIKKNLDIVSKQFKIEPKYNFLGNDLVQGGPSRG